jgi:hypothetical protein
MNRQRLKKVVAGLVMALSLVFITGIISTPEAQAQRRDRRWDRDRDDRRDNNRNSSWERRRQIERARAWERARQRERERERNAYRNRSYRNYPYYGNNGGYYGRYGGYNNSELERGYRNGLKEGRDDAEDRDSFNPSRHSSFRDGNPSYRQGFARGYEQGYRQYASYRRW